MLTWTSALFGITSFLGFVLLARIQLDTFDLRGLELLKLGVYYAVLIVPYFFAGLAMATVFRSWPRSATTLYAVNLVGSAAGCWTFVLLLPRIGGPTALLQVSLMCGFATALFYSLRSIDRAAAIAVAVIILHALYPVTDRLLGFHPASSKSLAEHMKLPGVDIEYTRWTVLARIDVVNAPRLPHPFMGEWIDGDRMRTITIDGDANTWLFRHPKLEEVDTAKTVKLLKPNTYTLAFMLLPSPEEVLIIGAGGGNEVATALAANAGHVTGVELNEAILAQSRDRLSDMWGGFYQTDRATAVNAEGRSFMRSSDKRYDIIQMSGVDTWSGLSSGAYVLSENYLYTVDADRDFLSHLTDDGMLSMGRFRLTPPRESLRMLANALRAMQELGWDRPEDHVMVVSIGHLDQARMLVRRRPFTEQEVRQTANLLALVHPQGNMIWYAPYMTDKLFPNPFLDLVDAVVAGPGAEREFHEAYPYDVTPVGDDRPFFFEYYKWKNFLTDLAGSGSGGQVGASRPVGLTILSFLLVQVAILCGVFIFAPLVILRARGKRMTSGRHVILGFGGLGLGFMFLEVGLMQKLVLLLGHPSHSITTSLFAVLVGSGIGSLVSGTLPMPVRTRIGASVLAIAVIAVAYAFGLDPITSAVLGQPMWVRQCIAVALVALLAFPMGMPFPLSLRNASNLGPAAVPWAWGINGGTSVLGSILCIVVAMSMGFRWVLVISAAIYLLTLPSLLVLAKRAEERTGS
jgi:hypothetical protein